MSVDANCLFCTIITGQIPSQRIDEDDRTVTFMDINPGSTGHALIVPKQHTRDLLAIGQDDLTACAVTAQRITRRAVQALGAEGVNLINCCGSVAWQTVFHFHLHMVPRYSDDGFHLPWVSTPGDPAAIAAAANKLCVCV